jgi:glyoxylase-like metal-dependent hydrolase (beta-lactamase superfamily II)
VARDEGSLAGTAEVHVLFEGYVGEHTASTVALVRDGDAMLVVDPGMVPNRAAILDPLRQFGVDPDEVTDVVFSHHHPDHTLNAALFPLARFHDHWAVYHHDLWTDRKAEGAVLSPSVRLIETPGHTPQDITTLASTADGLLRTRTRRTLRRCTPAAGVSLRSPRWSSRVTARRSRRQPARPADQVAGP